MQDNLGSILESQDLHSGHHVALVVYQISQSSMLKLKSQEKLPQSWNVLLLNMCWSSNPCSPPPFTHHLPAACLSVAQSTCIFAAFSTFISNRLATSQSSPEFDMTWTLSCALLLSSYFSRCSFERSLCVNVCNSFDVCFLRSPPF